MADSATAKKLDGRHERTEQTRLRILAAARDLMLSGNLEPTTTDIAKHAGITTRTLFRHFAVAESLHRQMIQAAEHSVEAIMDEPFPESIATPEQWRLQLTHIIDRRSRIYEHLLPIYISPLFQRQRSTHTHNRPASVPATQRRQRLNKVLPAALRQDLPLFEAIDATLGIEFWVSLRHSQNLSAKQARRTVEIAIDKLTGYSA